jgi:hypothetical protein
MQYDRSGELASPVTPMRWEHRHTRGDANPMPLAGGVHDYATFSLCRPRRNAMKHPISRHATHARDNKENLEPFRYVIMSGTLRFQ